MHIYQKDVKIEYTPFKFSIKVCENIYEDKVYVNSPSFAGFNPDDNISTLPIEKKEVLSEIIRRDLSQKDIRDICLILDKYNWKLTVEAIEEIK